MGESMDVVDFNFTAVFDRPVAAINTTHAPFVMLSLTYLTPNNNSFSAHSIPLIPPLTPSSVTDAVFNYLWGLGNKFEMFAVRSLGVPINENVMTLLISIYVQPERVAEYLSNVYPSPFTAGAYSYPTNVVLSSSTELLQVHPAPNPNITNVTANSMCCGVASDMHKYCQGYQFEDPNKALYAFASPVNFTFPLGLYGGKYLGEICPSAWRCLSSIVTGRRVVLALMTVVVWGWTRLQANRSQCVMRRLSSSLSVWRRTACWVPA